MPEAVVATLAAPFGAVLPVAPTRYPPNSFPVSIRRSLQCPVHVNDQSSKRCAIGRGEGAELCSNA